MKNTRTYVELPVPREVWELIWSKLNDAGYDHAIDNDDRVLDMHGLALVPENTTLRYRSLDDIQRIRALEDAIDGIWKAYGVVVSNGGAVSGIVQRHVVPAIEQAMKVRHGGVYGVKDVSAAPDDKG